MSKRYWSTVDERREAKLALDFLKITLMFAPVLRPNCQHSYETVSHHADFTFYLAYHAFTLMSKVTSPVEDTTIPFHLPPPQLENFTDSDCILDFRFRKDELFDIMAALYPRMIIFFPDGSTYEKIKCENKYVCPFETGFLLILAIMNV